MSTHGLNPNLPADNAPIVSQELRGQFLAIQNRFTGTGTLAPLNLPVSNPPTQAQMQALADKPDEVIHSLLGA